MSKINIYLSGNMTPSSVYYDTWTKMFADQVEASGIYKCTIAKPLQDGKLIVHHDLARLKKCDIIVANFSIKTDGIHFTGMIIELYEAIKQNKVVYAFTDSSMIRTEQANSPWIQQFVSKEFSSMQDVLEHLQNDNIPV